MHIDYVRKCEMPIRVQRVLDSAQTKPAGELVMNTERMTVQQKQAQAEGIQRDKHERLRGSLECAGTEELRLLSVRQNSALGRLAVRRRAAKHDLEVELRAKLARVKGGVARLWREHNRSRCGYGPRSSGADEPDAGEKLSGTKGGGRPTPSGGQQDGSFVDVRKHDRSTTMATRGSAREEGNAGCGSKGEEAERPREGAGYNGTSSVDEHLSPSGRRRPGDEGMNPDWVTRASGATTADGEKVEVGTAAASTLPASEVNQKKAVETRAASSATPAATGRRKPRSKRKGATTAASLTADSAVAAVTDAAGDGYFGVLSEGEAHALAALGRGAPNDPRLLLSTFPLPPPRRRQRPGPSSRARLDELKEESATESRSGDNGLGTGANVDGCGCDVLEGVGDCRRATAEAEKRCNKAHEYEVLDRAMDKLARKIQADEEISRRQLGIAPLTL